MVLFIPFTFSLTAKCMTLNGRFTLNFHYYKPRFQKLFYILTIEHIY